MDCGNKNAVLDTTTKILQYDTQDGKPLVAKDVQLINSTLIPPCYIGSGVVLENSVVGPHASIGHNTKVKNSVLQSTIVGTDSKIVNAALSDSMVGNHAVVEVRAQNLDIGDYCRVKD